MSRPTRPTRTVASPTEASARAIHVGATSMGSMQGMISPHMLHTVPPGCIVLDYKFCENCGRAFTKARGKFIRYCGVCVSRSLMPPDRDERDDYKAQLPDANIAHRSYHHVKYDDTLTAADGPSRPVRRTVPLQHLHPRTSDWVSRLISEMATGPRTSLQIAATIGCLGPSRAQNAVALARNRGIRLVEVGCIWPRPFVGRCPKLYAMVPNA